MARSRVELFEQIRKDRRVEGASIRELAGRHHVHRRTVRQALDSAVPPRKGYPQRPRPAIDAYASDSGTSTAHTVNPAMTSARTRVGRNPTNDGGRRRPATDTTSPPDGLGEGEPGARFVVRPRGRLARIR